MMRRILVDHAREHQAKKRPGAALKVALDDRIGASEPRDCEVLEIDQALTDWHASIRVRCRLSNSATSAACPSRRWRSRYRCRVRP